MFNKKPFLLDGILCNFLVTEVWAHLKKRRHSDKHSEPKHSDKSIFDQVDHDLRDLLQQVILPIKQFNNFSLFY